MSIKLYLLMNGTRQSKNETKRKSHLCSSFICQDKIIQIIKRMLKFISFWIWILDYDTEVHIIFSNKFRFFFVFYTFHFIKGMILFNRGQINKKGHDEANC